MSYRPEVSKIFGSVDETNEILIKTIYNVASNLGLLKKQKTNVVNSENNRPWFDADCFTAKENMKQALSVCKKSTFQNPRFRCIRT